MGSRLRINAMRTLAASIAAIGLAQPALAVLDRAGPVDPVNGFPQYYLDRNGVALELCVNLDPAVLSAGGCAVLPAAPPAGVLTVPEVFPTNWSLEHFYTLASVKLAPAGLDKLTGAPVSGAGNIVVNMGLEGSFASGTPTPGQQITFNRWRVQHINLACTGNYTYYTPNNTPQTFSGAAGGKIFETSDVGIGTFDGPLAGTTGPFLQWSATPGGVVKPPFVGPDGKKYIADYGAIGTPVTGSALQNPLLNSTKAWIPNEIKTMPFANYVLVEGPGVVTGNCAATEAVYTTTGFNLFGRYFEGAIPSVAQVDRVTYRAVDTNNDGTPDSFQIGGWATVQQKPTGTTPTVGMALFSGDPAAPTGLTAELAMTRFQLNTPAGAPPKFEFFQGTTAAKQATGTPAALTKPAATHARIRITNDTPATVLVAPLVDELKITEALWDSVQKTLTVVAESGGILTAATPATQTATNADCSVPCITLDSFGLPRTDIANAPIDYKLKVAAASKYAIASVVIPNVDVPPASITVTSSGGGRDTQPVMYLGSATGSAILQPDTASVGMNGSVAIPVLANDIGVAVPPNLQICTAATGGTCGVPSPTATCTVGVVTTSCTGSGGRLSITADNRVVYTPRANLGGITEAFWYQANTLAGVARAQVTVNVGSLNGLPDARDDLGLTSVVSTPVTINVLANDFAPAGVDVATLRMTQEPCNITSGTCVTGAARFDAAGNMIFTATSPGSWTMAYTFNDRAGVTADQGVVTVNAIGAEVLTFQRARWTAPKKAGQLGTLDAAGVSSVSLGQTVQLRIPNVQTGPQGCNNPTLGTLVGQTAVAAGTWTFTGIALPSKPATVYAYSPTLGGCTQSTVQ